MECNLTVAIDDVHPAKGWGLQGDIQMDYLDKLHNLYGVKFTLFIPSNYHNESPLSKHKDWIDWLKSKDYFELAAHGHYHSCIDKKWGEAEFAELDDEIKSKDRIKQMMTEWEAVGHKPEGFRTPGWLCHPAAVGELEKHFKYVAVHYEHNRQQEWNCKTLYGADGINLNLNAYTSIHNEDTIMLQSHIAGEWNDNVWNEKNYNQLDSTLSHLVSSHTIHFKTLSEI